MFIVSDVRHPFLFWTSVELTAEQPISLSEDRLGWDKIGAPTLEKRALNISAGETFLINARRSDGFKIGDKVALDRVIDKAPLRVKWQTTAEK
ncbi:MAG: hypothetical protein B7Y49_07180 [Sphingomonas sp. 28-62-11]|nr:MAG: hypothetical protein B7Y49_07180 [Sphingomonas sp. 28-62-11]